MGEHMTKSQRVSRVCVWNTPILQINCSTFLSYFFKKFWCVTDVVLWALLIAARRGEIIMITEQLLSLIDNGDYDKYLLVKLFIF